MFESSTAFSPRELLNECGYFGPHLREGYAFDALTIPYVGFASGTLDLDSACIAVLANDGDSKALARKCRGMGAPIVWIAGAKTVDWWIQRDAGPTLFESRPHLEFSDLVRRNKAQLDPSSVYRGKTIARVDPSRQLDFVDAGLLPLLREEAGKKLHQLVEEMTIAMQGLHGGGEDSQSAHRSVFTAVFRLLAGKILKDKQVPGFENLDLTQPHRVLEAVRRHYGGHAADIPFDGPWASALERAAASFSGAGSFAAVSPESLPYVYEQTLVDKKLRKQLGIHATPPWLVDYIVWRLHDWIREIPEQGRHVFEPAAGHAPFLLAAMRLLRLELQGLDEKKIHGYLKGHIHGLEVDDFAREIARLSLTLADIPNPNGWDLRGGDMFDSTTLGDQASTSGIFLCNPPFERFEPEDEAKYHAAGFEVAQNKAFEVLVRTLGRLPERAVFGLVLPQSLLQSSGANSIRALLLSDFEIREICLFADKIFEEGQPETVVLLGRRRPIGEKTPHAVQYRRVREQGVGNFIKSYTPDSLYEVQSDYFLADPQKGLLVPELPAVWDELVRNPKLKCVADVGQGFSFAGSGLLKEARSWAKDKAIDSKPAFIDGHTNVDIWRLPESSWLSPSRTPVSPWRSGDVTGRPQVLVNYVRASRGPWRLKAFLDPVGHAVINTYITVRPKPNGPPIEYLWAVLNSPVASAYMYCRTMKKHNLDGVLAELPLPWNWKEHLPSIVSAANVYLSEVTDEGHDESRVHRALLAMDAAVLQAYGLPVRLERALLDLFQLPPDKSNSPRRRGVGCRFGAYFSPSFKSLIPLHMYISEAYRRSTIEDLTIRIKPGESRAVLEGLQAAASAFAEIDE